ncbi:ArnT family glycosyltransferase [Acuticoccus kandeliae]|uniref:ArnT family glycosyltransferase n=1 Tax=Acuticoccus kandeliae TaxID=2073160 RepID=UPI000E3C5099|nr:glycosyltransferase family 39 protein [Acuticoccus kandeliae]
MTVSLPHDGVRAFSLGRVDRLAPGVVVCAILLYVALIFVVRLSLSPYLEIDEAQFLGAVDLRFVYGNSHPPLYNWLVRGALEVTGWRWALSVALVKAVLLAATHLFIFDAARRILGTGGGIVALAAAALMPQVSWMSAHTLAHSVLVMAASAGIVHAVVRIAVRPTAGAFIALGLTAGVGMLAKFNIALLIAPLAIALVADPFMRARIRRPAALWAPALFVLLAGPALVASALHFAASTERMEKLYRHSLFAPVDLPLVGIDGLLALLLAILASGGIVLGLILLFGDRMSPLGEITDAVRRTLWRTMGIGLAGFALFIFATDMSAVAERYLTPLMMPLPVLAAISLSTWRWRGILILTGAIAFLAVPVGMAGMVAFDKHRWARPYDAVATEIAASAPVGAITVEGAAEDLAANITLGLRRAGRTAAVVTDRLSAPGPVLVRVWAGHDPLPDDFWPDPVGVCPVATLTPAPPFLNFTKRTMPVTAVIYTAAACG